MKRGERKGQIGTGADLKTQENKASQADAAQKLDVSTRSVTAAVKVKDKAPELTDAVKSGDLDVKTAAKVADLSKRERKKVAESDDPKAAAKKALAKAKPPAPEPEPPATLPMVPPAVEAHAAVALILPATVDEWGIPIQEHAAGAFAAAPKFKELVQVIQTAQRLFNELANAKGGEFLTLPEVSSYRRGKKTGEGEYTDRFVHEGLEEALRQVKNAAPKHTVCPYQYADAPHPEKCRCCLGLNWTPTLSPNIPPVCIERAKSAFNVKEEAA